MRTINSTTHITNILSLQDFCDLTRKACQLKYFPSNEIVKHPHGWTKLAEAWEALIDEADVDIFRDAAYQIKWGIPPEKSSPTYHKLVSAVIDFLLQDGPAREAWMNHEHCISVIFETAREYNPWISNGASFSISRWHYLYTKSKMLLRVLNYRKGHLTKCKDFASRVHYFEARIIKLLPHAEHWPAEYWLNENYIFDALVQVCHFDYRQDITSYNALLHLATCPKRAPSSRDWYTVKCACNVKAFSENWAKAIWPNKTADAVIQLLLLAEAEADEYFNNPKENHFVAIYDPIPDVNYSSLFHSFLYSYVNDLLANQKIPPVATEPVKQALFNISMRR